MRKGNSVKLDGGMWAPGICHGQTLRKSSLSARCRFPAVESLHYLLPVGFTSPVGASKQAINLVYTGYILTIDYQQDSETYICKPYTRQLRSAT